MCTTNSALCTYPTWGKKKSKQTTGGVMIYDYISTSIYASNNVIRYTSVSSLSAEPAGGGTKQSHKQTSRWLLSLPPSCRYCYRYRYTGRLQKDLCVGSVYYAVYVYTAADFATYIHDIYNKVCVIQQQPACWCGCFHHPACQIKSILLLHLLSFFFQKT